MEAKQLKQATANNEYHTMQNLLRQNKFTQDELEHAFWACFGEPRGIPAAYLLLKAGYIPTDDAHRIAEMEHELSVELLECYNTDCAMTQQLDEFISLILSVCTDNHASALMKVLHADPQLSIAYCGVLLWSLVQFQHIDAVKLLCERFSHIEYRTSAEDITIGDILCNYICSIPSEISLVLYRSIRSEDVSIEPFLYDKEFREKLESITGKKFE